MLELSEFVENCKMLLAPLGTIQSRAMYCEHGPYADGPIFAYVIRDQLYFKADKMTLPLFDEAGSEPFTYAGKDGQTVSMNYLRSPRLDPDEIIVWATLGNEDAHRAKKSSRQLA